MFYMFVKLNCICSTMLNLWTGVSRYGSVGSSIHRYMDTHMLAHCQDIHKSNTLWVDCIYILYMHAQGHWFQSTMQNLWTGVSCYGSVGCSMHRYTDTHMVAQCQDMNKSHALWVDSIWLLYVYAEWLCFNTRMQNLWTGVSRHGTVDSSIFRYMDTHMLAH